MELTILYRGALQSCNFQCAYCPFAGTTMAQQDLAFDQAGLARFLAFIQDSPHHYRILFTPYGEAMIHPSYQEAMVTLSWLPNVSKVAVQTNGSFPLAGNNWLDRLNPRTAAFWLSYHPGQCSLAQFIRCTRALAQRTLRFSCGVVGIKAHIAEIRSLQAALPPAVYMWINAYKRTDHYYTEAELKELTRLDPLFPHNLHAYPSRGHRCRTGQEVFSVDANGDIRRCHFVKTILGNIATHDLASLPCSPFCPNETCHCHIGYIHLPELHQEGLYGEGLLERIPVHLPPYDQPEEEIHSSPNALDDNKAPLRPTNPKEDR